MRTAVVILNWNTEGFLRQFLPALLDSVKGLDSVEVVVADNASTDGSSKVLKDEFPQVRTIQLDKNYGFTGGYNRAFRHLMEEDGENAPEYFLLLNSDIEVSRGWIEPLIQWMDSHPECGACAPKLQSWQNKDMFEYAGAAGGYIDRFGYPFCRGRVMSRVEKDYGQYDSPAEVFWATGACLMVRSKVYESLGGLDERFFAHMEEIDLCWRMKLMGYRVEVVPSSVVWHLGGGTLPATSPFKLRLNYRNNLLMLSNNLARTYAVSLVRKGCSIRKAARKGCRKASAQIFKRMILDGMSAAVYLLTFKIDSFNAVVSAHRQYRELVRKPDKKQVEEYLSVFADKASIVGIYPKWIVFQYILRGDKIFSYLRKSNAL